MIVDFDNIKETVIRNFYGGEKQLCAKMYVDDKNKIYLCRLVSGASIGEHTHETGSEVIFILSGSGKAITDGIEERLSAGMCHYCEKGHTHQLINDGTEDLVFQAVVPQQ